MEKHELDDWIAIIPTMTTKEQCDQALDQAKRQRERCEMVMQLATERREQIRRAGLEK